MTARWRLISGAALLALAPLPLWAETNFTALSSAERAIFRAEIRAVLMDNPELAIPDRPASVQDAPLYEDDIASDLKLIAENRAALFSPSLPGFGPDDAPQTLALFIGPDCPTCDAAEAELRDLAARHDVRVSLIDVTDHADLARRMTAEELPFYVLPKMMLRGHMPAPVLERYLSQGTGQ
ncbi:glutaredoxin family protein [Rhodalgimonas zhirmunskyi]|uniref:Glutaredoxin family protein n=1 Tax=Rhodalgimonas zhirmunskyi TaxID=2964767 RepID=A0AAJ1UAZ9_9RHOB|nr:glutaredoxin family protein [Rhodoalgimonas zhirmunskyi]MDQ2092547.1 glutaredoxin family protein [Rhodoalgimonas zhirmunskyi]